MIRKLIKTISSAIPTKTLLWRVKPNVISVFYHTISNESLPHLKHLYPVLTPKRFEQDLSFLLTHFTPIDINNLANGKQTSKSKKPGLLLSFDDGFSEIFTEVLPVLKSKSIPATIFVNPNFVDNKDMLYRCKVSLIIEKINSLDSNFDIQNLSVNPLITNKKGLTKWLKTLNQTNISQIESIAKELDLNFTEYLSTQKPYLSIEQIKKMANEGFTIGSHSLGHPNFACLTANEQINEAEQSIKWISDNIPNQPKLFAFPFSSDGVSTQFFNHFLQYPSENCDMIFGTAGYKPTNSVKFMHRIPMEEGNKTAQQIINNELLSYLIKRMANRHKDNTVI